MISAISPRDGRLDHAGTADADVDHAIGLARAVEGARHERVVVRSVGEDHELGAAEAVVVLRPLRRLDEDPADRQDRVHVDPGGRRAHVDRGADPLGRRQDLGQRLNQPPVAVGPPLLDQGGEPADQVDLDLRRDGVERLCHGQVSLGRMRRGDRGDRAHGDPPVDDRDTVPPLNFKADRAKSSRVADQALANPRAKDVDVGRGAGMKVDPHRDGPDVKLVLADHAERGQDVLGAMQRKAPV
jgi:hypothetical protein